MNTNKTIKVNLAKTIKLLGDHLYKSSHVFLRENVQNAIDATRLLQIEKGRTLDDEKIEISVSEDGAKIIIEDWGIGMSEYDMDNCYWNLGNSSKNNSISKHCKVIGMFGVGAFANFGVCNSIEVHSWRKGFDKVSSKVIKKDIMEEGKMEYIFNSNASIEHFGTKIIAELSNDKIFPTEKLKGYLEEHVKYVNEKIVFNGQIISMKQFTQIQTSDRFLRSVLIPLAITEKNIDVQIKVSFSLSLESNLIVALKLEENINNQFFSFEGLLTIKQNMKPQIFVNWFLVDPAFDSYNSMNFEGFINTNLVEPNIARESIDKSYLDGYQLFFNNITIETLDTLVQNKILYLYPHLEKLIANKYLYNNEFSKFLKYLSVSLYGLEEKYLLETIHNDYLIQAKEIYTTDSKKLPPHLHSLAIKQDIIVILLDQEDSSKQKAVKYYLKICNVKELSSFQLELQEVDDKGMTDDCLAVKEAIIDVLNHQYFLNEFEVKLVIAKDMKILMEKINGKVTISVNIQSDIYKKLMKHSQEVHLLRIVNTQLIIPYLQDVLKEYIPKDIETCIEHDSIRMEITKVNDVFIFRGGGNWKGPKDNCICIISDDFPDLNGHYIRLPNRITQHTMKFFITNEAPSMNWINDTLFINTFVENQMLAIKIVVLGLLRGINDKISGSCNNLRSYFPTENGIYIPIAVPPLKDIIPFNNPVELELSFKIFEDNKLQQNSKASA